MSYEIIFIGWNYNEIKNTDKIWGFVRVGSDYFNFWGRRSKKLTFKYHGDVNTSDIKYMLERLAIAKEKKGYKDFTNNIEKIDENFYKNFERELLCTKLKIQV